MRRAASLTLLLFGLACWPVFAGEGHGKLSPESQELIREMVEEMRSRAWVGIEMRVDSDTNTRKVVRVVDGSPAEAAGFRKGDLLYAREGVRFSPENAKRIWREHHASRPGDRVVYTVLRDDKPLDLEVELCEIPERVLMQWVGLNMMKMSGVELGED
jgi:C-terminal processing protease CtpA/Prc